jgi:hypothetical protein
LATLDAEAETESVETQTINDPWGQFELPSLTAPPEGDPYQHRQLVQGPAHITTMFLPPRVADAIRQIKFECDQHGNDITQGTIVCHAMAYAFEHHEEWFDLVPADGRRKASDTNLSMNGRRTSFGLTEALKDVTDMLLWRAAATVGERTPAKLNIQATAIAWGLSRRDLWLSTAVAMPVMVVSEPTGETSASGDSV